MLFSASTCACCVCVLIGVVFFARFTWRGTAELRWVVTSSMCLQLCPCMVHVYGYMCWCVRVRAGSAHLLVVGLQDMVEPGDLPQLAQLQLHALQGSGQQLLLRRLQLLHHTHRQTCRHTVNTSGFQGKLLCSVLCTVGRVAVVVFFFVLVRNVR